MRFRNARGLMLLLLVLFSAIWAVIADRTLRGLNGSLDDSLKSLIGFAAQNAVLRMDSAELKEKADAFLPSWTAGVEEPFLEIRSLDDGRILARSARLRSDYNLLGRKSWKEALKHAGRKGWNGFAAGKHVRCRAKKVSLPAGPAGEGVRPTQEVLFIVAVERDEADRRFREICQRSGIGLGSTLLLAVAGVWLVVWRTTRPLTGLAEDVAAITPENIRPVRVPADPQLALLADRLNRSLEAVARSLEREKRFSSDVAHELLTPLGGLRTELEVALLKPRPAEDLQEAVRRCETMVREIQHLVEGLLELGRLEAGTGKVKWEEIDLSEAVDAAWNNLESLARSRTIAFENRVGTDARVEAGAHFLDIILKNLLSNVARYTPRGGRAWAECEESDHHLLLRVMNQAENLPPGFAEHAFERFWRGDLSRTRKNSEAGNGIGLGLSLARSAARAIGSELLIEVRPGPVVGFSLSLKPAVVARLGGSASKPPS